MNGHDFTLEQNTEARMMLAVARRGLAAAINDAENGIGHLSCDDPKIMEQVRAHWRRLYDTYMNADALLSDLESCARHLTDGDKWEPNPIADGMKPMEMAKGCACFIAETPDGGLIIPSEPTPGENTAKRLANTLNALTGDVLLDATGIRLLGTQFLFAYHSRLDRPVDYGVNLTGMRFPDPACGSGNFLTETYLELRRIENRILADLDKDGQLALDLGDDLNPVKVSISHFHGIEINGFACAVARTALWIAEQQALDDTESTISGLPRLPFTDTAHIRQGNALRLDWNELLPGDHCDYVMGNPPFIGQYLMSDSQKEDMRLIWDKGYDGYLDYATGWHRKASEYLAKPGAAFAFVSTNSISQGQPVPSLFRPLFDEGWRIRFAHRTFAWDAQSTDNAHVHVVIVGMDKTSEPAPILFEYTDIDGEPAARTVDNINGYLLDDPNVFVEKRMKPLSSELSPAGRGSQPTDGGNLILDNREEYDQAISDPIAAKYVRPFRGSRELINGIERWCLWLVDVEPAEIRNSAFLRRRVDAVREMRLASKKAPTRAKATTSWLFDENHQPTGRFLCLPKVFSGRREYATCLSLEPNVIVSDLCYTSPDPDGLAFAVIESRMFIVWQAAVGGRLKSDYRFSNTVVWNNLPLPALDDDTRAALIEAGKNVLAARANHPGQSLADLYDPDYMPTDLRAAHRELDKIADVAFGARKWLKDDDDTRLQVLFKSYTRMTGSSEV